MAVVVAAGRPGPGDAARSPQATAGRGGGREQGWDGERQNRILYVKRA